MKPRFFKTAEDFRSWFIKNHDKETEIWVGFWKKASGKEGMNYDQALDEALCFGWIDGITKRLDAQAYVQRFTPRRSRSVWSKINTGHVERLIKEGRMREPGLKAVEAAKADGRWDSAYGSPANIKIPEDFLEELRKHTNAEKFFETLNKTNKYHVVYQLQNAKKPETRQRRMEKMIGMLIKNEKFY